ncbi:sigma-54 dependent transcriptional regulator [Kordiimonas sp. SCSIO 12610]|uniref:sigma-54-dependent transcriptional regulator n=1 Tax=Kordiimonas sp. SCSIO 12610 TaxID=2829597 RepID=UPI00210EACF7|nr:sigma-54 dependent transcriptional regulator [Kordiimonas sp. SCSIO 12610]UTW55523.1 sigma-54-dependent Fis family transcriptional regulator [Kordiimonas sp. SCSIO 12610]
MQNQDATILIVEDSPTLALTYQAYLKPLGHEVLIAETGKDAIEKIANHNPPVIFLDLKLPDMDGLDILRRLKQEGNKAQIIVITAHGSVAIAVEAMQEGASDFILKPFNADRLSTTAKNALEIYRLASLVEKYEGQKPKTLGRFIGDSSPMAAVYRMINDAAPSKASVFIVGESGTGKELCAEAIHQTSPRTNKNFVALNCAAIPANLIESEIFGHKRGAFTGATEDREGAALRADGGTLFLDEICEMPMDLQAKLLRFIQTGQIAPVGSNVTQVVNVRFVCATNRLPWEEVLAGRFREDLYYRLHVIPIHLPPLRERENDVILIANSLLKAYAEEEGKSFDGIDNSAKDRLLSHSWPGNVRELGNVIQSAVVLNHGPTLTGEMLTPLIGPTRPVASHKSTLQSPQTSTVTPNDLIPIPKTAQDIWPLALSERKLIEHAIKLCDGKVGAAAEKLDVNPSTLYRKIKSWNQS